MKFDVYSIKGGFTAEACDNENIIVTGVGETIPAAVDDALLELGRFKTKCLKLGND